MISIILAILFLLFAILAWRDLKFALILIAGLLPTYLIRFSVGPIPFTVLELLILIVAAVWLVKNKGAKINIRQELNNPWIKAGLLLLAAASFAVTVAPDQISALGIWRAYFIEPFIFFLILKETLNQKDYINILKALTFSGIIISIFAIAQFIFDFGIPAPWDIEKRVTSFFEYPNAVGLFLAPIVGMSVVMLFDAIKDLPRPLLRKEGGTRDLSPLRRGSWRGLLFWASSITLGLIAIFLAETEAALVAIPAGLILTLLFSKADSKFKIRITGEAIIILIILAVSIPTISQKLFLQDYSGQVRLSQWSETINVIKQNPIFGAGLNGYPEALAPFHDPTLYEIFQYPHNIILNIWVELGLLGLAAFIWLSMLTVKSIRKNKMDAINCIPTVIKYAVFTALAVMLIHGLVDVPYFKNDLAVMTWIFIAILALTKVEKTD